MPRRTTPGTSAFSLDITNQAKIRFAAMHNALGFKTKTETFEAILYCVSTQDKIARLILTPSNESNTSSTTSWNTRRTSLEKRHDLSLQENVAFPP